MIGRKIKKSNKKNKNQDKIVLIDADSLLYFSSYGSEEDQVFSETKLSEKIYDIFNIIETAYDVEKYILFVKGKNNFRYKIFPDYKKMRKEKPPIIDVLAQYLVNNFQAIESHNAESDDYVYSCSQVSDFKERSIICSVDKDLLQIPGLHYNYQKNIFISVSKDEAVSNLAKQMITGDAADGIKCLHGYGPVKANKILHNCTTEYQYIKAIFKEYLFVYKNRDEAKKQLRLNYKLLKLQRVDIGNLIT